MILYVLLVSVLFVMLSAMIFRLNAAVFYVQIFFWIFGLVGILSVCYLEVSEVYIIEQFRRAHFNGAALVLIFMFFLHLGGVGIGAIALKGSFRKLTSEARLLLPAFVSAGSFFWLLSLILLVVLYINLLLSDPPPLLSSGYVDRFSYIYSTKLWWLLSPLGVVTVPLPIMLGWLLLESSKKSLVLFLGALYLLYLALIGQKFGGFMLSFFLLFMPIVISKVVGLRFYDIFLKIMFFGGALLIMSLGVVYYHYSQYSLSDEFGGPLGLIAYRIFGLQGHSFWGAFDYFSQNPNEYFDPIALYNGMEVVMRLIAPSIADEMIERGVNFTFGYFASLLINLNFFVIPALMVFGFFHTLLSYFVIKYVLVGRGYSYFVMANILILFNGFASMGSLSYIANFKFVLLLMMLLGLSLGNLYVRQVVTNKQTML